jgi:peptidylprolyl isomerase
MKKLWKLAIFLAIGAIAVPSTSNAASPEDTLYLDLKDGRVVIEMFPDLAPTHVARIKELARKGFYDGLTFHRVMDGFMAQTGDPMGDGTGGSGKKLKAEFNQTHHVRGVTSMARSPAGYDTADSQFFIMLGDNKGLDGQYTAWGRVISGMEFVDRIKKGDERRDGAVVNPDKIVRLRVAADVKE